MLRHLIIAAGFLMALAGAARADESCDAPPLTPAQWAALPDHDRIGAFQRLVQCAEEGIAIAESHVRNLSSARIAESADTWLGERNHLADLVQSYSAQLAAAKEEINALTNGRTALEGQIESLNEMLAKAASDRDAYLSALTGANGQIGVLVAERDKLKADLDDANGKLASKQAELDEANRRLAALDKRVDSLTIVIDLTNLKMTSLQGSLDDADAKIDALNQTIDKLNAALNDTNGKMATLQASLDDANGKIGTLNGTIDQLNAALADSNKKIADLNGTIADLKKTLADANQTITDLKTTLTDANQKIADLTNALCVASEKVDALSNRLAPYSAQFALGLKQLLAGRSDVFLDGNRVIVAAEVLFPTGSADLSKSGVDTVNKAAAFLKEFAPQVPTDLKWWLQVNGHTDIRPIKTRKFASNWELSTARALSVVNQLLKDPQVPAAHLAAAGFGQYQPLAPGNDPEVLRHNRRIEMEITGTVTPPAAPPSACAPKS